jgi:hypothetical protein
MPQIRLIKPPELEEVLSYLRGKYRLLSEAEIIKLALSEKYYNELDKSMEEQRLRSAYEHLMSEGKKLGDRFLQKQGLRREDVSEEDFFNLLQKQRD